ncbi:MAG: hypothetical protein WC636_04490 [Candidatus Margulisiibacteriota bacterium]
MKSKPTEKVSASPRLDKILGGILKTGRVAHAYLLVGPNPDEILESAQNFAKALNCESSAAVPCGHCLPCTLISENKFVDVINIVPGGVSLKIDQIRAVKDMVKFGPSHGKYQVVIIRAADTLTPEAANSFLKVLEEPNAKVVFILVAATARAILPTVRSRCHQIVFPDGLLPQNIEDPEIAVLLDCLGRRDLVGLLAAARDWARSPKDLDAKLNQLMLAMRENLLRRQVKFGKAAKIVMQAVESIKRKAAAQLALDAMFVKLLEEF